MSGEKLTRPVVCARHSRPIVRAEGNSLHAALLYLCRPFQTSVTRYTPSTWMRTRHEARDPRSTKLVRRTRYLAELTQCTRLVHSPLLSSFPRPFIPFRLSLVEHFLAKLAFRGCEFQPNSATIEQLDRIEGTLYWPRPCRVAGNEKRKLRIGSTDRRYSPCTAFTIIYCLFTRL